MPPRDLTAFVSALLAAALFPIVPGLRADTRLAAGRVVVDEVVADTTTLAPVRAPIPFADFRYAHVDADENVTFIADDPYVVRNAQAARTHGIYRSSSATGELECIVGPDTVLPGGGRASWIRGLQSDRGAFVFHAVVETPATAGAPENAPQSRTDALFAWTRPTGLVRLATLGQDAPGGGRFKKIGYGALDDETIVFSALDTLGRPALFATTPAASSLWRLVAATTDADPAAGQLTAPADGLSLFWFQPWLRDGALAFGALDGAGRESVWFAPLNDALRADGQPVASLPAPFRLPLADLPVPEGVALNYVETTSTSRGWIAFNAGRVANPDRRGYGGAMLRRGQPDYEGVFLFKSGRCINIVDTETGIPGIDEARFTNFDFWTTCDQGRVVFVASGPNGFRGVYLYDAARTALHVVATTNDLVDGLRPADFEVGSRPLVGERCAIVVKFAPGQRLAGGIYLATLHHTITRPLTRPKTNPSK
jgi:hypothetical protein